MVAQTLDALGDQRQCSAHHGTLAGVKVQRSQGSQRRSTHRVLWPQLKELWVEDGRSKEAEEDETTHCSVLHHLSALCNRQPEAHTLPTLTPPHPHHPHTPTPSPGNFLIAASRSMAKTRHMSRGQERADAVMALRIFSMKKSRLAMLTSWLSVSVSLAWSISQCLRASKICRGKHGVWICKPCGCLEQKGSSGVE